jgi:hypothetical protein
MDEVTRVQFAREPLKMAGAELGRSLLARFRDMLGVETDWTIEERGSLQWRLWGARQRAWLDTATSTDQTRTTRLQLRTSALEWFPGSLAQLSALSAELAFPTLAGIVRNVDHADQLELATSLDVQDEASDWAVEALVVATQVQAAEARHLAQSNALARVGLVPAVDLEANAPTELTLRRGNLLHGRRTPQLVERCWGEPEMSACVDVLKALLPAHVVRTPGGFHASFRIAGSDGARSILEVTADREDPLFGRGLLVVFSVPVRGGLLEAMALNEHEVRSLGRGHALGGWWAPQGGLLRHCSFYPNALFRKGVMLPLILAYARRAGEAADLVARL